jgi:hypothetical protein
VAPCLTPCGNQSKCPCTSHSIRRWGLHLVASVPGSCGCVWLSRCAVVPGRSLLEELEAIEARGDVDQLVRGGACLIGTKCIRPRDPVHHTCRAQVTHSRAQHSRQHGNTAERMRDEYSPGWTRADLCGVRASAVRTVLPTQPQTADPQAVVHKGNLSRAVTYCSRHKPTLIY